MLIAKAAVSNILLNCQNLIICWLEYILISNFLPAFYVSNMSHKHSRFQLTVKNHRWNVKLEWSEWNINWCDILTQENVHYSFNKIKINKKVVLYILERIWKWECKMCDGGKVKHIWSSRDK